LPKTLIWVFHFVLNQKADWTTFSFYCRVGDVFGQLVVAKLILYDMKHGTDRYGGKLGCFRLIDSLGKTRVIAASFVLNETTRMLSWVYGQFTTLIGEVP
jgi:hypothetical protein